jgi:hypothetical protein
MSSVIYFAEVAPGHAIKIGSTGNIDPRISKLRAQFDPRLTLLHTIPETSTVTEGSIHALFKHLRIASNREWFRPGPDLMEFIGLEPEEEDEWEDVCLPLPCKHYYKLRPRIMAMMQEELTKPGTMPGHLKLMIQFWRDRIISEIDTLIAFDIFFGKSKSKPGAENQRTREDSSLQDYSRHPG